MSTNGNARCKSCGKVIWPGDDATVIGELQAMEIHHSECIDAGENATLSEYGSS